MNDIADAIRATASAKRLGYHGSTENLGYSNWRNSKSNLTYDEWIEEQIRIRQDSIDSTIF